MLVYYIFLKFQYYLKLYFMNKKAFASNYLIIDHFVYIKILWTIPHLLCSLNLIIVHSSLYVVLLIPSFLSDLLLMKNLMLHVIARVVKLIILIIMLRMETFNPENKGTDHVIYFKNWTDIPAMMSILALDFFLFYYLLKICESNIFLSVTKTSRGLTVDDFGRISQRKFQNNQNNQNDELNSCFDTPNSPSLMSNSSNTSHPLVRKNVISRFQSESVPRQVTPRLYDRNAVDMDNSDTEMNDRYKSQIIKKYGNNSAEVLEILKELSDQNEIFRLLEKQADDIKAYFGITLKDLSNDDLISKDVRKHILINYAKKSMSFYTVEDIIKIQ